MSQVGMKLHAKQAWLFKVLLLSDLVLAPIWGQIHKTVHGLKSSVSSEQSLFSEHLEGSLVCQALDHMGSGEAVQTTDVQLATFKPAKHLNWVVVESVAQAHSGPFSARAPPTFL